MLVIDDNIDDRDICIRSLNTINNPNLFEIYEAESGDVFESLMESHNFDCILLDYSLPGRNGIEVLKRIRNKFPFIAVIMMTGQGNEKIAVQAMKLGAQDYITKDNISHDILSFSVKIAVERCLIKEKFEEQQHAVALFTRALAHDLISPLNSIHCFANFIREEKLTVEQEKNLSLIDEATMNMRKTIQMVRSYTEISKETKILPKETCDIRTIIQHALTNLKDLTDKKTVDIKIQGSFPILLANSAQLIQLFQNLISNALHYTGKEKIFIQIWVTEKSDKFEFSVLDNGDLIDNAYKTDIFVPFKRYSVQNKQGSGLGLALSKKIVELHNGEIWYEAGESGGNKFCFTIPISYKAEEQPLIQQVFDRNKDGVGAEIANILLVDDDIYSREFFKICLLERGKMQFNLFTSPNGKEAIDFIIENKNVRIDLVILDINMPIMDGFEFLEFWEKKGGLCPVVMYSSSDYYLDRKKSMNLGACDYLVKPISKDSFRQAIRKLPQFNLDTEREKEVVKLVHQTVEIAKNDQGN